MEKEIDAMLDSLADLRARANANAVFGSPVTAEGRTVIPVAKVAYGFGMGVGHETGVKETEAEEAEESPEEDGSDNGGVAGGGMMARPLVVIEVTPDGSRVKPVIDEQKLALAGGLLGAWIVFWLAHALVKIFGRNT